MLSALSHSKIPRHGKFMNGATASSNSRRRPHRHHQLRRRIRRRVGREIRQRQSRRHAPPGLPRRPEAAVGEMGVGDPGAAQEVAHMARLLPGAGDGGEGVRRGGVLPERPEGAAQFPRRGRALTDAAHLRRPRHPGRRGEGGSRDESLGEEE